MSLASLFWLTLRGLRNSSRRTSPGCMFGSLSLMTHRATRCNSMDGLLTAIPYQISSVSRFLKDLITETL